MTNASRFDPARAPGRRLRRVPPAAVTAFRTLVRGHAFAAPPPDADAVRPGASAWLVREPGNPRDRLAVAVWSQGPDAWRLGYLDRTVAARLAPRMDDGQHFTGRLEGWVDAPGGWRRPLLLVAPVASPPVPMSGEQTPAGRTAAPVPLAGRPPGVRRRTIAPGR